GACRMESGCLLAGVAHAFHRQCPGGADISPVHCSLGRERRCMAAACVAATLRRSVSISMWTTDNLRAGVQLAEHGSRYCPSAGLLAVAVPPVGCSTIRSCRSEHIPSSRGAGVDLGCYPGTWSFHQPVAPGECTIPTNLLDCRFPSLDISGGTYRGATRQGGRSARQRGPIPCIGNGRRRDGVASGRAGRSVFCHG